MPTFTASINSAAPPEEVWKILYDPSRFPEWWVGMETVRTGARPGAAARAAGETGDFTMYPTGYPDFPMPQRLEASRPDQRVVISCLVSDLRFEWTLDPLDGAEGTRIGVHVDIPDAEAHRLDTQREVMSASLARLAGLAALEAGG
jgi:uncharacterized protein YndB with AHSA1/START domain